MFGVDDELQRRQERDEGIGWFGRGMGRWRWVGEDENKGWVGEDEEWVNGGRGQRMDRWSGLHVMAGPCVEGWFWVSSTVPFPYSAWAWHE